MTKNYICTLKDYLTRFRQTFLKKQTFLKNMSKTQLGNKEANGKETSTSTWNDDR